jgi:hypothetical protein
MPAQSSLAAGVLQTAMRVSISIGLAISAGVYGSIAKTPAGISDVNLPFEHAYLCSIIFAATSLLLVPFMKIGMQGKQSPPPPLEDRHMVEEDRPRTAGEYSDHPSTESHRRIIANKPSQTSLWSSATAGSVDSFFPRWSWEPEIVWPDDRYHHKSSNVVYEVCVKCLEERIVVMQPNPTDAEDRLQASDPNPFRRIEENFYSDPDGRAIDGKLSSEGVYIKREAGTGSFSSTETLLTNTHMNSRPLSRVPSPRGPSSGDATIVRHGIASSNFSSAETLHAHPHDPMFHRMPSQRTPLSRNVPRSSFPAPPQGSNTMPVQNVDVRMSGARIDRDSDTARSVSRDTGYRISKGGKGWV